MPEEPDRAWIVFGILLIAVLFAAFMAVTLTVGV